MISTIPSIPKAVEAIHRGDSTPIQFVDLCLDQIARLDSRVHAWVSVDTEGARREAERLTALARRGQILGPLHGIPVAIKDIIDVAGWPTACGSPLRTNRVATADAELVSRLRRAGAIILGKTVTTEFASFDPPPTCNPWNLERTPGGSSSGSAAAVATQMCLAAIGSQTGGSIVRPASFCGVVGLKPTYGAVSLSGIEPLAWHMDHPGPITACVEDAACLLRVISDMAAETDSDSDASPLAILPGFFFDRADAAVRQVFAATVERVRSAGMSFESLTDVRVDFEEILISHRRIMAVEAAAHHRQAYQSTPGQFGKRIASLIDEGLACSAVDYAAALRHQSQVRDQLAPIFAGGHLLATPATTTAAPKRDTTGDPAFNSPWSFSGLPSITIPAGLTDDGLPCGLQLVGPAHSEPRLLRLAAHCETVLAFRDRPSLSAE